MIQCGSGNSYVSNGLVKPLVAHFLVISTFVAHVANHPPSLINLCFVCFHYMCTTSQHWSIHQHTQSSSRGYIFSPEGPLLLGGPLHDL